MEKLTKIEHLESISAETRMRYLKKVDSLRFKYMRLIEGRTGDVRYDVHIGGGEHRAGGVHASEVGGCLRALTYAISSTERIPGKSNCNMLMRFAVGHALHSMLQHDFHTMCKEDDEIGFEDEVNIDPSIGGPAGTWNIHSHCDGVFTFFEKGEPYLRVGLEIKTASDKDYSVTNEPKTKHREQTCVYMSCLDLPLMWVLYYNKSNSNFTGPHAPWLYKFDAHLWRKLEKRMSSATIHSIRESLPARDEGFECSWCPFSWTCDPMRLRRVHAR